MSEPSSATVPPSSQVMPPSNDDEMAGTVISETQESEQEDWGEVPEEYRKWDQEGGLSACFLRVKADLSTDSDALNELSTSGRGTWSTLVPIIKARLVRNTSEFLRATPARQRTRSTRHLVPATSLDSFADSPPPEAYQDEEPVAGPSTAGGLIIPPFRPLQPRAQTGIAGAFARVNGATVDPDVAIGGKVLKAYMTPDVAWPQLGEVMELLDGDARPPFTAQRLGELITEPTKAYRSIGKYLRAVEKLLRVSDEQFETPANGKAAVGATPLFSPIPWLNTPAADLDPTPAVAAPMALPTTADFAGRVDELDVPEDGGHAMSDHPQPLTSTTDLDRNIAPLPRSSSVGSLTERFKSAGDMS